MFNLGQIIMTARISTELENNKQFLKDVKTILMRYQNCDWGEISEEDKQLNQSTVRNKNSRIFAVYETCEGEILIITEIGRGYTSVLFPSEYKKQEVPYMTNQEKIINYREKYPENKSVAFPHEQKDNDTTNK